MCATDARDELDIGDKLKRARTAKGLSQRQLSKMVGISHTAVAKIENGAQSPTLSILQRIARALGLTVDQFIGAGRSSPKQTFFRHEELTVIMRGPVTLKQVGTDLEKHSLQMMYDVYEPGADSGKTMLSHFGEEAGVIISGTLEVTVGEDTKVLKAGDAYFFDSSKPHRYRNVGTEKCVVVSAATPPTL